MNDYPVLSETERERIRTILRSQPELLAAVREAAALFEARVIALRREPAASVRGQEAA